MTDDRQRVKFITAIVADDIRREANGKEIIIGVYTSDIILSGLRSDGGLIIAISLIVEASGVGDIPIQLQVIGPSGAPIGVIHGKFTIHTASIPGQQNSMSLTGLPLPVSTEGNIVIQARQYDDEGWQSIRVIPITVRPNEPRLSANVFSASAIAIEQPSSQSTTAPPETSSRPEPSHPAPPARRRRT